MIDRVKAFMRLNKPLFYLTIVSLTLIACGNAHSQRRFILWSGDVNCGQRGSGVSTEESIRCESLDTPRGKVSAISHDGISLAVAFVEERDHLILGTRIKNETGRIIDFDSDKWGAAHFKTMEDALTSKKPILAETAIPSRDLVREISSGVALDNSADTFLAGVTKQTEVREVRRADGSRQRTTVITPDLEAERLAADKGASRRSMAAEEQDQLRTTALTKKWLSAGDSIKGLVYFRRVKKAGFVIFSLKVNDTVYVFRLHRERVGKDLATAQTK